jgi:hypothetical protein
MSEERLTAIIAIRVCPSCKKQMRELAVERGETLSEFIFQLIGAGLEKMAQEDVKQESEKR